MPKMSSLKFGSQTEQTIDLLRKQLPQAIILTGDPGVGLLSTAEFLAEGSLEAIITPTNRLGSPDNTSKGIIRTSQIRQLVAQSATIARHKRVFIIDNADQMNHNAQNAFLKALEEPVPNTHFILTAHAAHQLLTTIRSRAQTVRIERISAQSSQTLLSNLGIDDHVQRQQMLFLANGLPAELSRLAGDADYFQQASNTMRDSRTLLQGSLVEKNYLIEKYQSDRAATLTLIKAAMQILRLSVSKSPSVDNIVILDRASIAYDRIAANGNIRLQLVNFIIQ